jgi:hypothetical protein
VSAPAPPSYGEASLAGVLPGVLRALGVAGGAAAVPRACLLLVDGLGWELLRAHADAAPYLTSLLADSGGPVLAGFPATTATSIASLATGLPPGGHGILGYEVAVPGTGRVMNSLSWDGGPDPERWQPYPTLFERAHEAGVAVTRVGPGFFDGSGLTRAALRGGAFAAADAADDRVAAAATALRQGDRSLVYVYYGDLDATGHREGCRSQAWVRELARVDTFVRRLAEVLPAGAGLWVTADHGMVDVPFERRVDLAAEPALGAGVELLAGEPRARYVHAVPGAAADVLAAWRERLAACMWVLSRDEAVEAGWFGAVRDEVYPRIGDVVAAARDDVAVVDSAHERPELLRLVGMHGSLTDAERLVPLLTVRA